jgi:putative effector of murein hydrolase
MPAIFSPLSDIRLTGALFYYVLITVAFYWIALTLQKKLRGSPLANPALLTIAMVTSLLLVTRTNYAAYFAGAHIIHFMLGPATVALAVPMVAALRRFTSALKGAFAAIAAGSLVSAASGYWLVILLGGSNVTALSMAPKAATTPIAIRIAGRIGGDQSLTAALAILAGILVAVSAEHLLAWARLRDWPALGIATGTAGSGIGTARAFQLSELAGALAGLAIGINGLMTSILTPLLIYIASRR